jgi:hypothetical protein
MPAHHKHMVMMMSTPRRKRRNVVLKFLPADEETAPAATPAPSAPASSFLLCVQLATTIGKIRALTPIRRRN